MRISAGELGYYRESLREIGRQASDYVYDAITALGDGVGVTAAREAAIAAIQDSVGIHGEMAQALAAQFFDEVCQAEGLGVLDFELIDDVIDFGMLEERVRYFAKALVDGDGGRFADDCSRLADMYAWRCNRDSMVRNCERNGVRYARVPTSGNPCDWCVMLASRGFVYHSQGLAEAGGHEHCCCVVMPGGPSTTVEGYDPDALYDQWKASGFMPSGNGGATGDSRRIASDVRGMQEMMDGAGSIEELKSLIDAANRQFGDRMSDRQRRSLQWAIGRARKRLA